MPPKPLPPIDIVRACQTAYHDPTDTRGARVSARHMTTGRRTILAWDDSLGQVENHARAALVILTRDQNGEGLPEQPTRLLSCADSAGGYVFVGLFN